MVHLLQDNGVVHTYPTLTDARADLMADVRELNRELVRDGLSARLEQPAGDHLRIIVTDGPRIARMEMEAIIVS